MGYTDLFCCTDYMSLVACAMISWSMAGGLWGCLVGIVVVDLGVCNRCWALLSPPGSHAA